MDKDAKEEFKIFCGSDIAQDEWLWCSRCHRTYKASEFRKFIVNGKIFLFCHYKDCTGDLPIDSRCWNILVENNPVLPKIPKRGEVYEM